MRYTLLLFVIVSVLTLCSFGKKKNSRTVAFAWGAQHVYNGDTLIIPCQVYPLKKLNDTAAKYLNGQNERISRLMISQGFEISDSLDFSLFPNTEIIDFAGDADLVQNRHYAFMDLKKLRVIRCWSVVAEPQHNNNRHTKRDIRKIIHRYRPDVRVLFPNRWPPEYMF